MLKKRGNRVFFFSYLYLFLCVLRHVVGVEKWYQLDVSVLNAVVLGCGLFVVAHAFCSLFFFALCFFFF